MKNRLWQKNGIGYDYTISYSGAGYHFKILWLTIMTLLLREYWKIYRGPGFLAVVRFGSPPPPPVRNFSLFLSLACMSSLYWREKWGRGWEGDESYNDEKTWSSINHPILSATSVWVHWDTNEDNYWSPFVVWFLTETYAHGLCFGNAPPPGYFQIVSMGGSPLPSIQREERPGEREVWWPMRPKSYEGAGMGIGANFDECPKAWHNLILLHCPICWRLWCRWHGWVVTKLQYSDNDSLVRSTPNMMTFWGWHCLYWYPD